MSNHYHIIAWASNPDLSRAMQYFNSRVALRYNKLAQRSGHLWGDRFFSTIISTGDYYLRVVRYIYRNPLRAGIANGVGDFEDSSFSFYAWGKKILVFITGDHLAIVREGESTDAKQRFFRSLVEHQSPQETQEVKKGLRSLFFGPPPFVQSMKERFIS